MLEGQEELKKKDWKKPVPDTPPKTRVNQKSARTSMSSALSKSDKDGEAKPMKKPAAKAPPAEPASSSGVKRPQAPDPEPVKKKDKNKSKGTEERDDVDQNEEKESRRKAKIERERQIEEVLQEFEDSNEEAGKEVENPLKARQLKPQTSGPTVDEDEMMEDFWRWREERAAEQWEECEGWEDWECEEFQEEAEEKAGSEEKVQEKAQTKKKEPSNVPDTAASPPSAKRSRKGSQAPPSEPEEPKCHEAAANADHQVRAPGNPDPEPVVKPEPPTKVKQELIEPSMLQAQPAAPGTLAITDGTAAPHDPSQDETQPMEEYGLDLRNVPEASRPLLKSPPHKCKPGASRDLLPGLKDTYQSDADVEDEEDSANSEHDPDYTDEEAEGSAKPAPSEPETKITSKSHKKAWNKLDRLVKTNPGSHPQIAKIWINGDKSARNRLLVDWVKSAMDPGKVESELVWKATKGHEGNKRRMLLTVSQMRKPPHYFPKEKIKHIVRTKAPVKDEDCPHLQSAYRYWCTVEVKTDDYTRNELGAYQILHVCMYVHVCLCCPRMLDCLFHDGSGWSPTIVLGLIPHLAWRL